MQALEEPKERKVVESRPHHHMRGSGGSRVGEKQVYSVVKGVEQVWESVSIYGMWLLSPRWLIP